MEQDTKRGLIMELVIGFMAGIMCTTVIVSTIVMIILVGCYFNDLRKLEQDIER